VLGRTLAVSTSLALAACYSPPQPACGFACGPSGACPAGYYCARDGRCHLDGTPESPPCAWDAAIPEGLPDAESAPFVISRSPGVDATGVSVTTSVTAVFSEDVVGVDTLSFSLFDGSSVLATVSYVPTTATLTPASQLSGNTLYSARLLLTITDLSGNGLTGLLDWGFTTAPETAAPLVIFTDPAGGTTGNSVITPITVRFNEPVQNVTTATFVVEVSAVPVAGTITNLGPRDFMFTPTVPFSTGVTVDVTLGSGITDNSGNALVPAMFSFGT
jgi:hypothetical protein